jgi:hypothetical protein
MCDELRVDAGVIGVCERGARDVLGRGAEWIDLCVQGAVL